MSYTVGIPRAMLFYRYYPMWRTFLQEMGTDVLLSDITNFEVINQGSARVVSDTCLPLKAFIGHVISLATKCDFILIPVLRSTQKKVLNCSRFLGLPDVTRVVIPESPPILEIEFDMNRGRTFLYQQIFSLGRHFSPNPLKIISAARNAWETHLNYIKLMADLKITHEDAIHLFENQKTSVKKITRLNIENNSLVLGLIGHSYMLNDETINHHIQTKLRQFNASLITPEMLSITELREGLRYMNTDAYWVAEEDVVGAGGHYIKNGLDGIIGIMAFGCGPDSLMMHLVERKARTSSIPYMCLTFDEHTAAAGIITRLEAFLDMIKRRTLKRRSNLDACYLPTYR